MKKIILALPIFLALAGCGSDIDVVKNGVMEFNQTTTIGQVLDNWKSCESSDWNSFETDNGMSVVEFTCEHRNVEEFMRVAKSLLSARDLEHASNLNVIANMQTFQFTINKNESFQIDNVQITNIWEDGTAFTDSQVPLAELKGAYSNKIKFDPKIVNHALAGQYIYAYTIVKQMAE